MRVQLLIFLVAAAAVSSAVGSNILFLSPFPVKSHWIWLDHFVRELLDRGHHVTAVTNYKTSKPHANYTEIIINPPYDIPAKFPVQEVFKMRYNSHFESICLMWDVGLLTTEHAFKDKGVNKLIERDDLKFDLVILEQFFHESWLLFAHKYKVPIVTIGTLGHTDYIDRQMGLITPLSFVPHMLLQYSDRMTFVERCINTVITAYDMFYRRFYYMAEQQRLADKYFKNFTKYGPVPTLLDAEKQISFALINSHTSTSPQRPSMPNLISVGGVHVKPPKALPADLQKFLDEAATGAVYFSLGSYVQCKDMPKDKLNVILKVLGGLKHKVLWKYEDESIENVPANVMIRPWMPQSDILAHKNIVLFITHGGVFGTQEGIQRGVPMLFLPFYGDQHRNAMRSEAGGFGRMLKFSDVTEASLTANVNAMLTDKSYMRNVKQISRLFTDNLTPPMQEAMHWIEYAIRNDGAQHLKSNAVNMPWYSYLMLDILALVCVALVVVVVAARKLYLLAFCLFKQPSLEDKSPQVNAKKKKKSN